MLTTGKTGFWFLSMKIKTSGLKKKKRNTKAYHWWLVQDKPKSKGRLSQLGKWNRKRRLAIGQSEFQAVVIAEDSK